MTPMTRNDTEHRIRALLVRDFKVDPVMLTFDAHLDELGVDSIGVAELIFNIEDEFGMKLPNVSVEFSTFGEVVTFIDDAVSGQRTAAAPSVPAPDVQPAT